MPVSLHQNTSHLILEEAQRLILDKGVENLKLHEIADPLNITVPAIYKHFTNREDVVLGLAKKIYGNADVIFFDDRSKKAKACLEEGIGRLMHFMIENPAAVYVQLLDFSSPGGWRALEDAMEKTDQAQRLQGKWSFIFENMNALLQRGRKEGDFRKVDLTEFYSAILGAAVFRLLCPNRDPIEKGLDGTEAKRAITSVTEFALRWVAA